MLQINADEVHDINRWDGRGITYAACHFNEPYLVNLTAVKLEACVFSFAHWRLSGLLPKDHYDWGLRAIKSVLVVAGSLKRGDPGRAEDQVLMRALRDFNIPKIVTDDMPVFMGLIGDLFPALDVPRKRDLDFEKHVKESILDLKLQAEDNFVLKVWEIWFLGILLTCLSAAVNRILFWLQLKKCVTSVAKPRMKESTITSCLRSTSYNKSPNGVSSLTI